MRIAIAIGDPNGIGPEIAVKAAARPPADVEVVLVGDPFVIEHYVRRHSDENRPRVAGVEALVEVVGRDGLVVQRYARRRLQRQLLPIALGALRQHPEQLEAFAQIRA